MKSVQIRSFSDLNKGKYGRKKLRIWTLFTQSVNVALIKINVFFEKSFIWLRRETKAIDKVIGTVDWSFFTNEQDVCKTIT